MSGRAPDFINHGPSDYLEVTNPMQPTFNQGSIGQWKMTKGPKAAAQHAQVPVQELLQNNSRSKPEFDALQRLFGLFPHWKHSSENI